MSKNRSEQSVDEILIPEELENLDDIEFSDDIEGEIIPTMTAEPVQLHDEKECIVQDGVLLGLYDEIVNNCRADREKVDQIQANFEDMVINDGDSSGSSKEALVNLMKIKTDINDKLSKVADLMTRIKLKEKDTFKPYLAIPGQDNKRAILKALEEKKRRAAQGG